MPKLLQLLPVLASITPDDFGFDYAARVPIATIVIMFLSIILAIAIPIVLFIHVQRRYELDGFVLVIGLLAYLIGGYIAPALLTAALQALGNAAGAEFGGTGFSAVMAAAESVLVLLALWIGLKICRRRWTLHLGNLIIYAVGFTLLPFMMNTVTNNMNLLSTAFTVNEGQIRDGIQNYLDSTTGETEEEMRSYLGDMFDYLRQLTGFHPAYWMFLTLCLFMILPNMFGFAVITGGILAGMIPSSERKTGAAAAVVYIGTGILESLVPLEGAWLAFLLYLAGAAAAFLPACLLAKKYLPEDVETFRGKSIAQKKKEQHDPFPDIHMPKDR